jgi:hypothetical protein
MSETPSLKDENPSPSSESGDICYWSPGPALCIFFGQTQPCSRVNHIGKVVQGLDLFERINAADRIVLRKKELVRGGSDVPVKGRRFFSSPNGLVAAEGARIL